MFPGSTLVITASGKYIPIKDVTVGEWLISHTGKPRQVLEKIERESTGKVYRMDVGGRSWVDGLDEARYIFHRNKKFFTATVSNTTNRDFICGFRKPPESIFKNEFNEKGFSKLADMKKLVELYSAKEDKTAKVFYSLAVEEEHSFLVVGYSGSFLYGSRSL